MVGDSAAGGVGGYLRPLSLLDLANKRVLLNSPHASSGGGWAGRPCSETGSTQGRGGARRPSPVSRHTAAGATSSAVPPATAGSQATWRVMTTNSWRSSAAAIAA